MARQETRDPRMIRENPNQMRSSREPEAFRQLVESIAQQGILQPPGILPDNTNVWGWGRVLAAIEAGLKEIPVIVLPASVAGGQPAVLSLIENMVRSDLTQPEVLIGLETALRLNPACNQKMLAASLGLQESTISRYLAVGKNLLTREPFLAGKMNLTLAYQIAISAPEDREGLMALALSGTATREDLAKAARNARSPIDSAKKLARVVCPLSTGTKVTVTGAAMDLETLIESLAAVLESARKANKEQLDIKTWARVLADKAKAG